MGTLAPFATPDLSTLDLQAWGDVQRFMTATTGVDGDMRTMTTEFVLWSKPTVDRLTGESGTEEVVVTLSTSHHGRAAYAGLPDRVYVSRLDYLKRSRFRTHTTSTYGLYTQSTALVHRVEAPRYSAKMLGEVHETALDTLAARYDTTLEFQRVFVEALTRYLSDLSS